MKHLIMFWMLLTALTLASGASAENIVGVRIDGARNVMVLTLLTSDCNQIMPMVRFNADKSRNFGGAIYDLDFATTRMACPESAPRRVQVEVQLPRRSAGDFVTIMHDEVILEPKAGGTAKWLKGGVEASR